MEVLDPASRSESAALIASEAIIMVMIRGGRRRISLAWALEGGAGDRFELNMLKMLLLIAVIITCFPEAIHSGACSYAPGGAAPGTSRSVVPGSSISTAKRTCD